MTSLGGDSSTIAIVPNLQDQAKKELQGTTRFLIFDEDCRLICSSFEIQKSEEELSSIKLVFQKDREEALRNGIHLLDQRYEIHQFSPALLYGRSMVSNPETSEAIAVCKLAEGPARVPIYGLTTFLLPELTARQVPQLLGFCRRHLSPKTANSHESALNAAPGNA